jgi:hypothetical protein
MIRGIPMRAALAALLLLPLAPRPAWAEDAAKFDVLKVVGEDTTFLVVPKDQVGARKSEIARKDKEAEAAWASARDAFTRDKANKGQQFLDPRPEASKVSVAKTFDAEAEARQYADEAQRKAEGTYAVIAVTGLDGKTAREVIRQNKIKAREAELNLDFLKGRAEWQEDCDAWYKAQVTVPPPDQRPFSETKPLQPKVERLKTGLASKEEAQKALQDLEGKGKK